MKPVQIGGEVRMNRLEDGTSMIAIDDVLATVAEIAGSMPECGTSRAMTHAILHTFAGLKNAIENGQTASFVGFGNAPKDIM